MSKEKIRKRKKRFFLGQGTDLTYNKYTEHLCKRHYRQFTTTKETKILKPKYRELNDSTDFNAQRIRIV